MNVSIELLEFPLCIKNKILRIKNITKLNIEYIAGKNITQNNLNIDSINLEELTQNNSLLQIIPNKKHSRFDQESLTFLSIIPKNMVKLY